MKLASAHGLSLEELADGVWLLLAPGNQIIHEIMEMIFKFLNNWCICINIICCFNRLPQGSRASFPYESMKSEALTPGSPVPPWARTPMTHARVLLSLQQPTFQRITHNHQGLFGCICSYLCCVK